MLSQALSFFFTEERLSKLERELENANDLLAAARQRGKNKIENNWLQSVRDHSFLEEFELFIT